MIMHEHKVWVCSGVIESQTSQIVFYLILNYYLQLKSHRQDFTLALTSIVHSPELFIKGVSIYIAF